MSNWEIFRKTISVAFNVNQRSKRHHPEIGPYFDGEMALVGVLSGARNLEGRSRLIFSTMTTAALLLPRAESQQQQ
jgi:hypothetical protein